MSKDVLDDIDDRTFLQWLAYMLRMAEPGPYKVTLTWPLDGGGQASTTKKCGREVARMLGFVVTEPATPGTATPGECSRVTSVGRSWPCQDGRGEITLTLECDAPAIITRLQPIIDERAEYEGRPARFGWDPATYREYRGKCEAIKREAEASGTAAVLPPEMRGMKHLRGSRNIEFFASREADGRTKISVYTHPEDNVPKEVIEDVARLLELEFQLASPAHPEHLEALLRERFPSLPQVDLTTLTEAAFQVLRQPAAWQEGMAPGDRRRYLAVATYHEVQHRDEEEAAHRDGVRIGKTPVGALVDETLPDPGPDLLGRLLERDLLDKAPALLNLRDGEKEILLMVRRGEADSLPEACRIKGLPDSYRVGLLTKLKKLAK